MAQVFTRAWPTACTALPGPLAPDPDTLASLPERFCPTRRASLHALALHVLASASDFHLSAGEQLPQPRRVHFHVPPAVQCLPRPPAPARPPLSWRRSEYQTPSP